MEKNWNNKSMTIKMQCTFVGSCSKKMGGDHTAHQEQSVSMEIGR